MCQTFGCWIVGCGGADCCCVPGVLPVWCGGSGLKLSFGLVGSLGRRLLLSWSHLCIWRSTPAILACLCTEWEESKQYDLYSAVHSKVNNANSWTLRHADRSVPTPTVSTPQYYCEPVHFDYSAGMCHTYNYVSFPLKRVTNLRWTQICSASYARSGGLNRATR